MLKVKGKKLELEVLTLNSQHLEEEFSREEAISTANTDNAEGLRGCRNQPTCIKDCLALDTRKVHDDKLQHISTRVDPEHPESPFVVSQSLNKAREWEVSNCSSS